MNKRYLLRTTAILGLIVALVLVLSMQVVNAAAPLTVYGDGLAAGWSDWSWQTTLDLGATTPVHGGSKSLSATYTTAWAGVYLRSSAAVGAGYDTLRFWINGGIGAPQVKVAFYDVNSNAVVGQMVQTTSNTWMQVDVPMAAFGSSSNLWGLVWQENTGSPQSAFYLDDIQLLTLNAGSPPPAFGLSLHVDAAAGRHTISPDIYGMNFADATLAGSIQLPVNRWGGNSTTRYNYLINSSNHAQDWYYENIGDDVSADQFVIANKAGNTDTIMTMPLIGYTAKSADYACGFSIAKYGQQQKHDIYQPDCGNGIMPDGKTLITGNNPLDTSIAITPAFVTGWINHLTGQFHAANAGGVRFYDLDNEPMLWSGTHRDVHPNPLTYDELRDRTYQYASAIKAADPSAQTLGPVEWGWPNYFYSALDTAQKTYWDGIHDIDRLSHGNMELVAWYLDQMKQYEQAHGVRILDYLDLHFYPQADNVALSPVGSQATQDLRLRSTRSLWDPTYLDESWIDDKIRMIPRMHDWVNTYYPGTKLAITEYNFGAVDNINGAVTEADVLGIFGREGLDLATMWDPPKNTDPTAYAFRMYRNYDGLGSMFGDTAVQASSDDQSKLSVYAAQRADNTLTIMVVNKTITGQTSTLNLANFSGAVAQVYTYSTADLSHIIHRADLPVTANSVTTTYAAQSITLLVIPAGPAVSPPDAVPVRNYYTIPNPTLTWNRVTSAVRYDIQIASNSSFIGAITYDAHDNLSFTPTLTNGPYYWHVRACTTATDCGNWSTYDSFVVDVPPPP